MVAVVAAVTVAIVLAVGVGRASTSLDALAPKPGRPSGYHGPAYPGMLVQDQVAAAPAAPGAAASISALDETLTAGGLTRTPSYFGPTVCSPVSVTNHSLTTKDVGPAEWKLQQPDGVVETFAITGTLRGGQLAPGGTATGTVCFADSSQSGTFVLLWQPLLRAQRGVWLLHF
jgi:hypothetical protein